MEILEQCPFRATEQFLIAVLKESMDGEMRGRCSVVPRTPPCRVPQFPQNMPPPAAVMLPCTTFKPLN